MCETREWPIFSDETRKREARRASFNFPTSLPIQSFALFLPSGFNLQGHRHPSSSSAIDQGRPPAGKGDAKKGVVFARVCRRFPSRKRVDVCVCAYLPPSSKVCLRPPSSSLGRPTDRPTDPPCRWRSLKDDPEGKGGVFRQPAEKPPCIH